jgi:nitrite reductase/ring-hydroxylating ferredoxin subunit
MESGSLEPLVATDGWPPFLTGCIPPPMLLVSAPMTTRADWQTITRPSELHAITFPLTLRRPGHDDGQTFPGEGFAILIDGHVRAYQNFCPHTGSPLDWLPGRFFSDDGRTLVCATHGARFDPLTGACLSGPCPRGLYPLAVHDLGDTVSVPSDDIAH